MTELFNFDEMYNDEDELHIKSTKSMKNYFELESELIETKTKLQVLEDKFTNLERLCFGTQQLMDIFRQNNEKYKQKEKEEFKDINKKLEERIDMLEEELYLQNAKFKNVKDYVEKFYERTPKFSMIPIENRLVDINAEEILFYNITDTYTRIQIDGIYLPTYVRNAKFIKQFQNIDKIIINFIPPESIVPPLTIIKEIISLIPNKSIENTIILKSGNLLATKEFLEEIVNTSLCVLTVELHLGGYGNIQLDVINGDDYYRLRYYKLDKYTSNEPNIEYIVNEFIKDIKQTIPFTY
jgi:hypothetical protein